MIFRRNRPHRVSGKVLGTTLFSKILLWKVLVVTLGTTLGRLRPLTPKNHRKITFLDLVFKQLFIDFSYFSGTYFSLIFHTSLLPGFGWKKTPAGLNFESLGVHFFDQSAKIAKSENYDSVRKGHENQAFDASVFCFHKFCETVF